MSTDGKRSFGGPQFEPFGVEGFVFLKTLEKIGGGTNLEIYMACERQVDGIGLPLNSLHQLSRALEVGEWIENTGTVQIQLTEDVVEVPKWTITKFGLIAIYNNARILKALNCVVGVRAELGEDAEAEDDK